MRISQNRQFDNLLSQINSNRARWQTLQEQVGSSKRVSKPSDDARAFSRGASLESVVQKQEQYQTNVDEGIFQAQVAQDAVQRMVEKLTEAKVTAVRGSNDTTLSDSDREDLADEIASVRDFMVDLGNTEHAGRYLFGGTATLTTPFSEAGGVVTYNGNNSDISIKSSDSTSLDVSVNGETLISYSNESVFDLLTRIENSLRTNDTNAVRNDLSNLDEAIGHVARQGSKIGNSINKMEFAYEQFESMNITLKSQISAELDADYADVLTELSTLDLAYNASLQLTRRITGNTLLNYL